MTAVALQNELIQQISGINNISTLNLLNYIIKVEVKPRKLSEFQKKLIAIGIQEMKDGKGIPHEIVMHELEQKYGLL